MTDDIPPELLKRYLAGEPDAIAEVVAIIIERDRELLDRLALDD
jgi:hypothetical protein